MKKKKIKSLLSGEKFKFRKMKNYSNELKRENERIQSNLNFISGKHEEFLQKYKLLKCENERLKSENKVMVQSIDNLIKEAKTMLKSNDTTSKDDLQEGANQATFFDGGEWVPQVGDEVEIISNKYKYHSFEVGEKGHILVLEDNDGYFLIGIGNDKQYLAREEFKKA